MEGDPARIAHRIRRSRMFVRTFLAIALFAAAAVHAQPATIPWSTPVEQLAREALGSQPGMAVAGSWREGRAAVAGAAGGGAPLPVTAGPQATLFEIGSISKVFTGLLLAQAVAAGDLQLDDTLGELLRGKVQFTQPEVAAITLQQLVTHTSCLPRLPPDFRGNDYARENPYRSYDRARMWATLGKLKIPQAAPCDASYSNFGFGLLGEILSERYGKPWAELVRERITAPVGMRDTLQELGAQAPRLAPAFSGSEPASQWDMLAFSGAGALRSTPQDLLLFGRAILAGRQGPLGLPAERMLAPLARFGAWIGYGIFVEGPEQRRTYGHTGGTGGYRSTLLLAPDTGEVLVLLASNAESAVWRMSGDLMAHRYPLDNPAYALAPEKLADYVGVFRETRDNAYTFVAQDGRLYLRSSGNAFIALTPSGPDTFNYGTRGKGVFEREDGKVKSVRWTARGTERMARLTPEPVPAAAVLPQEQLQAYVGRYRSPRFDFFVTAANGQLAVQLTGQERFLVYPVAGQPDRFMYDTIRAEIQFERDPGGAVQALVLHQNRPLRAQRAD
jgi:serine-type D-Ala-D-Ala carboxypeptidase/endopeptidase